MSQQQPFEIKTAEDVKKALENEHLFNWSLKPGVFEKYREMEIVNRFDDTFDEVEFTGWIIPADIEAAFKDADFIFSKFEGFPTQQIPNFDSNGVYIGTEKSKHMAEFFDKRMGIPHEPRLFHTEVFEQPLTIKDGEELIISYDITERGVENMSAQIADAPIIIGGSEDEVHFD